MDRPDLYYEPHKVTGGDGTSENYRHTRAANGIVRYDPPPSEGWWPLEDKLRADLRQVRILGYIGIAVTHLMAFGLGWALGWALS